jgi:hypothetical protein
VTQMPTDMDDSTIMALNGIFTPSGRRVERSTALPVSVCELVEPLREDRFSIVREFRLLLLTLKPVKLTISFPHFPVSLP